MFKLCELSKTKQMMRSLQAVYLEESFIKKKKNSDMQCTNNVYY